MRISSQILINGLIRQVELLIATARNTHVLSFLIVYWGFNIPMGVFEIEVLNCR